MENEENKSTPLLEDKDKDKGKIEFDGINVNEINSDEYLKNFSIITQDINLFTDTIMENIKYGNLSNYYNTYVLYYHKGILSITNWKF